MRETGMRHGRRRRERISAAEARRIALAAQGFGSTVPGTGGAAVGTRQLHALVARLGVLQIDSVNVFERSHYLPALARLGAYDRSLLDRILQHDRRPRSLGRYVEYWAHEAAAMPVDDWPLFEWRRERSRLKHAAWRAEHASTIEAVLRDLGAGRPLKVREIEHDDNVSLGGGWWNKNDVHWATQVLFSSGEIVAMGRTRFERHYALAELALPADARTPLPRADAMLELVRRSSERLGVATVDDLADYHRLPIKDAAGAVASLVDEGTLQPIEVASWGRPAYLHAGARIPRSIDATALLSPFDPVVWHRPRALRAFGFHYRISIYTPAEKREHGYYVLPVMVGDELVGRIDLKSDRARGVLRVQHATIDAPYADRASELASRIAPRIREAAAWQGLESVSVTGPGTWAPEIAAALG